MKNKKVSNEAEKPALNKGAVISRAETKFLLKTLDDIFGRFIVSGEYFYGEKEDRKVLSIMNDIKSRHGL